MKQMLAFVKNPPRLGSRAYLFKKSLERHVVMGRVSAMVKGRAGAMEEEPRGQTRETTRR